MLGTPRSTNPVAWTRAFFSRLEAAPAEHRLWELLGQRGVPAHRLRHRRQAEGEDGGGVPAHEEPRLRAPSEFSGLHHVSTSCSEQHVKPLGTLRPTFHTHPVPSVFSAAV